MFTADEMRKNNIEAEKLEKEGNKDFIYWSIKSASDKNIRSVSLSQSYFDSTLIVELRTKGFVVDKGFKYNHLGGKSKTYIITW